MAAPTVTDDYYSTALVTPLNVGRRVALDSAGISGTLDIVAYSGFLNTTENVFDEGGTRGTLTVSGAAGSVWTGFSQRGLGDALSITSYAGEMLDRTTWLPFSGPTFTEGQTTGSPWSFDEYAPPAEDVFTLFDALTDLETTLPSGMTFDAANGDILYDGTTPAGTYGPYYIESTTSAEADWQSRISGQGVVWYHDFASQSEVDQFRCDSTATDYGDVGTAQNPNEAGTVTWSSTGGITSGYLQIRHSTGSNNPKTWYRPMAGLTAATNGRGQDDPCALNTTTRRSYNVPTIGGAQIGSLMPYGYYADATTAASWPGQIDGDEYYVQLRAMVDVRRSQGGNFSINGDKFVYLTTMFQTNTGQEIVITDHQYGSNLVQGESYFNPYASGSPSVRNLAVGGNENPGTQYGSGICVPQGDQTGCWKWPRNEWVTFLFHIKPYTSTATADITMYVAERGRTSYLRILQLLNTSLAYYEGSTPGQFPIDHPPAYGGIVLSGYASASMSEYWHRYSQIIFSKQMIPIPADPEQTG